MPRFMPRVWISSYEDVLPKHAPRNFVLDTLAQDMSNLANTAALDNFSDAITRHGCVYSPWVLCGSMCFFMARIHQHGRL